MKLLVLYLGITLIGYLVGSKLKKNNKKIKWAGKVQTVAIIILIFLMGTRLGANKEVVKGLSSIGLSAFVLTVFILAGSILSIVIVRKIMGINRNGVRKRD